MSEFDQIDRANALADRERNTSIRSISRAASRQDGSKDCADCGEPIPEARRLFVPGAVRCIDCQNEFEGGAS